MILLNLLFGLFVCQFNNALGAQMQLDSMDPAEACWKLIPSGAQVLTVEDDIYSMHKRLLGKIKNTSVSACNMYAGSESMLKVATVLRVLGGAVNYGLNFYDSSNTSILPALHFLSLPFYNSFMNVAYAFFAGDESTVHSLIDSALDIAIILSPKNSLDGIYNEDGFLFDRLSKQYIKRKCLADDVVLIVPEGMCERMCRRNVNSEDLSGVADAAYDTLRDCPKSEDLMALLIQSTSEGIERRKYFSKIDSQSTVTQLQRYFASGKGQVFIDTLVYFHGQVLAHEAQMEILSDALLEVSC